MTGARSVSGVDKSTVHADIHSAQTLDDRLSRGDFTRLSQSSIDHTDKISVRYRGSEHYQHVDLTAVHRHDTQPLQKGLLF